MWAQNIFCKFKAGPKLSWSCAPTLLRGPHILYLSFEELITFQGKYSLINLLHYFSHIFFEKGHFDSFMQYSFCDSANIRNLHGLNKCQQAEKLLYIRGEIDLSSEKFSVYRILVRFDLYCLICYPWIFDDMSWMKFIFEPGVTFYGTILIRDFIWFLKLRTLCKK